MKPVNIENLERLLEGIWSGELLHNQQQYFCGTACCLAGWDVALSHPYVDPEDRENLSQPDAFYAPNEWSRKNNNLTHAEAELLFQASATKDLHIAALRALKEGKRLTESFTGIVHATGEYEGHLALELLELEDLQVLEFLGDIDGLKVDTIHSYNQKGCLKGKVEIS